MDPPQLTGIMDSTDDTNDTFFRSSPLLQYEDFEALRSRYKDVPDVLIEMLNHAFQATHDSLMTEKEAILWDQDTDAALSAIVVKGDAHLHSIVVVACSLAGKIYYRATKRSIPFEDPVNREDAKSLGDLLNTSSLSIWRGIPFIYLWV